MTGTRINELRNMIAAIGNQQIAYHEFFPKFADTLVVGLGKYLGDEKSVALTTDDEEFQFDTMYRHEGVKLSYVCVKCWSLVATSIGAQRRSMRNNRLVLHQHLTQTEP